MLNLKKLTFYLLIVFLKCVLINPIHLIKELTMHLSQLDPFSFYLSIENNKEGLLNYLSNKDIKHNYKILVYTFLFLSLLIETNIKY